MCRQDGNFSEQQFRDTVNACLANNVGNMLNRTLGLLRKYHGSVLPVSAAEAAGEDHPLRQVISNKLKEAEAAYNRWAMAFMFVMFLSWLIFVPALQDRPLLPLSPLSPAYITCTNLQVQT